MGGPVPEKLEGRYYPAGTSASHDAYLQDHGDRLAVSGPDFDEPGACQVQRAWRPFRYVATQNIFRRGQRFLNALTMMRLI